MKSIVLLGLMLGVVCGLSRDDLFPFVPTDAPDDIALLVGDDISTAEIQLQTPIAFYDDIVNSLYVSIASLE